MIVIGQANVNITIPYYFVNNNKKISHFKWYKLILFF